jgi:hypothetical protein
MATLAGGGGDVACFSRSNRAGKSRIGDIVIATLNNTVTATVTGTLESLFAELDLHLADSAADSDLVINELDQWRNPERTLAGSCTQTFNLVVVAQEMTQR